MTDESHQMMILKMEMMDSWPSQVRKWVHDFGFAPVYRVLEMCDGKLAEAAPLIAMMYLKTPPIVRRHKRR